jgi:PAS domain S-box-containing protein
MERTFKAVSDYTEGRAPKYAIEFRMKHKDGSYRWVYATGQVVERQADGKAVRMIGVNQDITERKQDELEIQASNNRLELAMDTAQLGSWEANLITNKTLFDARYEMMLGFAPGELAGENPTHVSEIHPDDMTMLFGVVMDYATGKRPDYEVEFRTSTKTGEWKWIYAKAQIVERMADGTPLRLAGVNQDITARKQAEQERETLLTNEREARREAQEALRMKDLFLATMSHELRTPLNAMIGFQHLMLFSQQLDADNSHMAERSIANSQRLLNLINNILDISRIATGGLKIVPVTMSPRHLATSIGTDLGLQAKEKGLTLKVEVGDAVPANVIHDEERMGQIMLNLVGNALKFTEANGTITLRVNAANEKLVIEVQDTGIGIPASQKHVIFDDFVQLDNSSTRKHQGAGLGLAIVKRLALLMQGSITVESEIGQGSTFVVTLPLNLKPEMYQ